MRRDAAAKTIDSRTPREDRLTADVWRLLLAGLVLVAVRVFVDPDLGGHLAYGLDHLSAGRLQRVDTYSYTASGLPWVNHEWLFEWVLGVTYSMVGPRGLSLLSIVLWSSTGAILLWLGRRSSGDVVATGVLFIFFTATITGSMGIRPQAATYLLFAVLLAILETARGGRVSVLLFIPVLFVAWVNLHGGWIAGLGVLGAYGAGLVLDSLLKRSARGDLKVAPPRPASIALFVGTMVAVAALCTLVNPYGLGLWRWIAGSLGRARPQIMEWRPIGANATGITFVLLMALVVVSLLRRSLARTPLAHVLVLAVTAYVAIRHVRHIPFFTMSAMAFAPGPVRDLLGRAGVRPPSATRRQQLALRALMLMVIAPFLFVQLGWPPGDRLDLGLSPTDPAAPYPTGAFEYMERNVVAGNMVTFFDWSQLVVFRYRGRVRIAYDGRFRTVYPEAIERAYLDLFADPPGPDWRRLLDDWPTEWLLIHAQGALGDRLRADRGWWLVYEDDLCALFRRAVIGQPQPEPERRRGVGRRLPFRPTGSAAAPA